MRGDVGESARRGDGCGNEKRMALSLSSGTSSATRGDRPGDATFDGCFFRGDDACLDRGDLFGDTWSLGAASRARRAEFSFDGGTPLGACACMPSAVKFARDSGSGERPPSRCSERRRLSSGFRGVAANK